MARKITDLGWRTWEDWGSAYRSWKFNEDIAELGASKDDYLCDRGPQYGERRFSLRRDDATRLGEPSPELVAATLFMGVLPPWRPPRPGERAINRSLNGIRDELKSLRFGSNAEDLVQRVKDLVGHVRGGRSDRTNVSGETGNSYLRLVFDGQYDNGDPYKDFEFLIDAQLIPATRTEMEGPRHAIKGDLLRVIDDGDRFSLRRDNRSIGRPEWWQLKDLFVGLKRDGEVKTPNTEAEAPEQSDDPAMRALRRMIPDGPRTHHLKGDRPPYRSYYTGGALEYAAFYASETIEDTPVREGDFVLRINLTGGRISKPERAAIRGVNLIRVRRSVFPALSEHTQSLRFLESWYDHADQTERLRRYLTHSATLRAADHTSPIFLLRGLRSPVSAPIEASSDDAALFDLITDSGGTMPKELKP